MLTFAILAPILALGVAVSAAAGWLIENDLRNLQRLLLRGARGTRARLRVIWCIARSRAGTTRAWVTSWFWWHDSWPAARECISEWFRAEWDGLTNWEHADAALYYMWSGQRYVPPLSSPAAGAPAAGDVPGRESPGPPPKGDSAPAAGVPAGAAHPAGDLVTHPDPALWEGHTGVHAFPPDDEVA